MHNHDTDLISALAEGILSPDETQRAREEIGSCTRCSADLAMHETALQAIAVSPRPELTEAESTALRASVAEAIGLPVPELVEAHQRPARKVPWPAIAMAGASLVAIVAIVPVVGLLNTGGDDAGVGDAVALEQTTTMPDDLAVSEPNTERSADDTAAAPELDEESFEAEAVPEATTTSPAGGMAGSEPPALPLTVADLEQVLVERSAVDFAAEEGGTCHPAAEAVLGTDAELWDRRGVVGERQGEIYVLRAEMSIQRILLLAEDNCSELWSSP